MRKIIIGSVPKHLIEALAAEGIEVAKPRKMDEKLPEIILHKPTYFEPVYEKHPNENWRGKGKRRGKRY